MLEATMILLDNSSFAINTDYSSLSRWSSQLDSAKTVFNTKINSNPENVVGIMTMAGKGPQVLTSPTQDYGAIVSALSDVRLEGEVDLITSIQVAQLALKHRQNKNLRQRIIALVGSPLESTSSVDLVKLGKRLKKNNVACDIVNFGEDYANEEKLREFVEAVNSQDNSHLVSVPPGSVLLSDMIILSGMLTEDGVPSSSANGGAGPSGTSGGGGAGGDNADGEFGVDPNLDPELAMALRMSLEEERARQAASQKSQEASSSSSTSNLEAIPEQSSTTASTSLPPALSTSAATGPASALPVNDAHSAAAVGPTESIEGRGAGEGGAVEIEDVDISGMDEGDEDADLARALALSTGDAAGNSNNEDEDMAGHNDDEDEEITEEEAMARAIAMSMQEQQERESK